MAGAAAGAAGAGGGYEFDLTNSLSAAVARGNPVVFFDVTIGGTAAGRIKMELFKDVVPRVRPLELAAVVVRPEC